MSFIRMYRLSTMALIGLALLCVGPALNPSTAQERGINPPTDAPVSASVADAPLPRDPDAIAAALGAMRPRETYLPAPQGGIDAPQSHVSHFVIPRRIKVGITPFAHCGDWLDAGQPITEVIEIDFIDYVKNVLPNEWPNSWHPESLKAGAMAAKTFAWWRMTLTNPRPQGVDVVDNTCDQRFIRNSTRPTTDAAVDATWPYRMSRDGLIKNVHYLDTDQRCASTPILRPCMGQWGTKYMADGGATWQEILHHYYDPTDISLTNPIPPNKQVIANPKFDLGLANWTTWGGPLGVDTSGGVLRFYRAVGSPTSAVLYQDVAYEVPRGTPFTATLHLGNSANTPKQISVHLHASDHWDGALSCAFTLYPGSPPLKFALKGTTTDDFRALRLEIAGETADGKPAYLIDNVTVKALPADHPDDTDACTEPAPGAPTVTLPAPDQKVHNSFELTVTPGQTNFRPGYNAQYHVQVSTAKSWLEPLFDNGDALATTPRIPLTLEDGVYYARVRQFDGLDRYSPWTPAVRFTVVTFPGKPVLTGPSGPVDGRGLAFAWSPASDADDYMLRVFDGAGALFASARIPAGDCAETCVAPLSALSKPLATKKPYQWAVVARNSDAKTTSNRLNFTPDLPGMPTQIAPDPDATVPADVAVTWTHVPAADTYRLIVKRGTKTLLNQVLTSAAANCAAGVGDAPGTCSVAPGAYDVRLVPGRTYAWQIVAIRATPLARSRTPLRNMTVAP